MSEGKRDEDLLADLLVRWEELHQQGREVSAEELCRDCPHLADELARRIEALKVTSWLDQPIEAISIQTEPSQPSPCEPRTLAGRYRLDDLIAEGGFAQVWRGFDQELQRVVAIKVPKPSRLGSVEAFIAEARKVARLKHPGTTVEEALALGRRKFDKNYFEAAAEAYTEAIRLDPGCAEAYKRRGACKFNEGKIEVSLPDFSKALELDPKDAETCKYRALAYANLQEFSPAISDLKRALKLGPADPAPYHDLLARVYSNRAAEEARNKMFAEAAADVTEAMKHDPKAAIFYHQRGSCYFNLKEYEKAAADFTEAIRREPAQASHYRNRGHCLQALGREEDARADFQKAKSLENK
jgi:tetratricopeptide (TPR) repeat protein